MLCDSPLIVVIASSRTSFTISPAGIAFLTIPTPVPL